MEYQAMTIRGKLLHLSKNDILDASLYRGITITQVPKGYDSKDEVINEVNRQSQNS